jgi:lipopolysaccharide/colanic/teichoic acid biosynthesis glycosyltransferase
LLFPTEFQRFAPGAAVDLADSTRPQPIVSRFADFASWDSAGADGNRALQQEAISALGRFAKRILDLLLASSPHPLEDVARYGPGPEERLEVTPGSGLWQVTARRDPSFETCVLLDVRCIRNWSLLLDCNILLRTIRVVFAGEGL